MKVVYVILHYLATTETIECVESLLKLTDGAGNLKNEIVIVDNGSPNKSFDTLSAKYKDNLQVHIILSERNLGFSKGNNLGFDFAKNKLNADFIVLLNNDTVIEQKDFSKLLISKYNEVKYAVLGPDIITADGFHQNPGNKQSWGLVELTVYRMKKRLRIFANYFNIGFLLQIINQREKDIYRNSKLLGDVEDTILHGACMIFSPDYIDDYNGLYPDTFLYMEEDILKLCADYCCFKMLYTGDLEIIHKEDAATNMIVMDDRKRDINKQKLLISSSWIYSKLKLKLYLYKIINRKLFY